MKSILKFAFILFLVNLIAASILAATYNFTKAEIQKQENMIREEALKQVMPEKIGDRIELVKKDGIVKYWKVLKGDNPHAQAYIFIAKKYGYSSVIETMIGIKKDGTITGVRILSQNETPGLGARISEIISSKTLFSALRDLVQPRRLPPGDSRLRQPTRLDKSEKEILSPYFTEQFTNRNINELELSRDGIHAITGATISSRAVLDSIKSQGLEILDNQNE